MTTIQRTELGGGIIILSDVRLPRYEAKIWPQRPGKDDSRYDIILNADGITLTKFCGKDYTKKNAEKNGLAWIAEMVAKHVKTS